MSRESWSWDDEGLEPIELEPEIGDFGFALCWFFVGALLGAFAVGFAWALIG